MDEYEISSTIGVQPVLSLKINVKKHYGHNNILLFLGILFLICWIMAFCDLIGLDGWQ